MTTLEKLKNTLVPSLYAGAVGAGIYFALYGGGQVTSVPLGPLDVPLWAAIGSSVALGNMTGEVLTQFVLPHIPKNEMLAGYEEKIIPPAISGLATYGVLKMFVSDNPEIFQSVLLGAGSSIGGKYIYGMMPL